MRNIMPDADKYIRISLIKKIFSLYFLEIFCDKIRLVVRTVYISDEDAPPSGDETRVGQEMINAGFG